MMGAAQSQGGEITSPFRPHRPSPSSTSFLPEGQAELQATGMASGVPPQHPAARQHAVGPTGAPTACLRAPASASMVAPSMAAPSGAAPSAAGPSASGPSVQHWQATRAADRMPVVPPLPLLEVVLALTFEGMRQWLRDNLPGLVLLVRQLEAHNNFQKEQLEAVRKVGCLQVAAGVKHPHHLHNSPCVHMLMYGFHICTPIVPLVVHDTPFHVCAT